jgi:hypothetical protein
VSGDEHNPKVFSQIVLMLAHNFSQATSNTIANRRPADSSSSDKTGAAWTGIFHREHPERHQTSSLCVSVLFHMLEFRRSSYAPVFRKGKRGRSQHIYIFIGLAIA